MTVAAQEATAQASSPSEAGTRRWWTLASVGLPIVAASVALIADQDGRAVVAAVALIALIPAWFVYLALASRHPGAGRALRIAVSLLALVAIAASPNAGSVQSLVYPLLWTMAPTLRSAIAQNVVFGAAATIAFVIGMGPDPASVGAAIAIGIFSLAFSLAFGTWITRIAEWGEERARVLAELTSVQDDLAAAHREDGERLERERISRELHDTLTQSLTGLVMLAQRARGLAGQPHPDTVAIAAQLELIDEVARDALEEARTVVAASASLSVDGGLAHALRLLAQRVSRETGIEVATTVAATTTRELEVVLLRCCQEALANVRKHSGATRADVRVVDEEGMLVLAVTDDGRGVDAGVVESGRGFGLAGMRDRLQLVGGELVVTALATGGTSLVVRVPAVRTEVVA